MARESSQARRARARHLFHLLKLTYPDAQCALDHRNPLELLVATILSAQCTDQRVNMVTPALFAAYPTAAAYAAAPHDELAAAIRSTGFYNAKARHIQGAAEALIRDHDGQVPDTLAELVELPGVGRKTASVVLGVVYGKTEGVVVDTHVGRISRRLGLTKETDAARVERDLMELLAREIWIEWSHLLIWHGRQVCTARKPKCEVCGLLEACPRVGVAR